VRISAVLHPAVLLALADGRVGERQAKLGQYVRPGALVLAIVPYGVWVVANFKETQIPDVHVGDDVTVSADGVPSMRFAGTGRELLTCERGEVRPATARQCDRQFHQDRSALSHQDHVAAGTTGTGRSPARMSAIVKLNSRTRERA
jgi:hypothetical protein